MAKRQKLAIIDAHALIHRAYHALPPMNAPDGTPTNAVYGFTTMLLKMMATVKPTHVIAAFDMKGPTFRHEKYENYKAHRKALDDDLIIQFDIVRKVARAFSIPVLEKSGYEADDIIGTVVKRLKGEISIVIITGDMDTLQLVEGNVSVFAPKRGMADTILYTPEVVQEVYGFAPALIPDYKGLAGDSSDNIKGVAGIGTKTAKELVGAYGALENIFKHVDDLPTRAKTRLVGNEKDALFSRELATIHQEAPIEISLEDAVFDNYNEDTVRDVFRTLGFRTLLSRIPGNDLGRRSTIQDDDKTNIQLPEGYAIAQTPAEQQELQEVLRKAKIIAFDTETDGLGARTSPVVGMSFAIYDEQGKVQAWYVPIDVRGLAVWKNFFEDENIAKTGHNIKYDMEVLLQAGITLKGVVFDSMIASYLLRPGSRTHGMDDLAQEKLDYTPIPITDLIGSGKSQKSMKDVPLIEIARYAAEDADVSLRLYSVFLKELRDEKLQDVLSDIEIPLIEVLAHIENTGVAIDSSVLATLRKKVVARISAIEQEIWSLVGESFNVNSPKQLQVILFDRLKLPTVGIKKTQTGYSTAAGELEKLAGTHAIITLLSEYREISKLKSTYLDLLPPLIDKRTGRIYASFNQTVAATGRLSSSDPNLQNIPVRTEMGQEIRSAFIAKEGSVFVKADYSQLELRIAAHMAQDKKMLSAFQAGQDIHRATAASVFGISAEEVTDDMRRQAKTLNFGVLYGMGSQSFARAANVSVEEARSFIDRYKREYSGIEAFVEKTVSFAQVHGYVETMFGRKRYMSELNSNNPAIRAAAERMAFNFPIQGTEADIIKKAMIQLYALIQDKYKDSALVLTVHDELVCEVPSHQARDFAFAMKGIMEGIMVLDSKLVVDVGIGGNWNTISALS